MKTVDGFDIVVLGAGVSGLLIASRLSARHRVVVIEQEPSVPATKYWLTDGGCIDDANPDLRDCVDSVYGSMDYIAYDLTRYRGLGTYYLLSTPRLIERLTSTITANGGTIATSSRFYSCRHVDGGIAALVNDTEYRAKLLIDCMGVTSPIVAASKALDLTGYFVLYGASYPARNPIDPVGLHTVTMSDKPTYLEVFPASDGTVHTVLIRPTADYLSPAALAAELDFIVNRTAYADHLDASVPSAPLCGVIPVGTMRVKALDRIMFYGEAGQVNPAISATALTRMLYTCDRTAAFVSERLADGRLSAADLAACDVEYMAPFLRRFQLAFFEDLIGWDTGDFRAFVREFIRLDDQRFINDTVFGNLTLRDCLDPRFIGKLVTSRSAMLLGNVARSLLP